MLSIVLICTISSIVSQNDTKNGIYDDDGNISSYKNGKLHGKQVKKESYSEKIETSYYNNREILKKEYNYFLLEKNNSKHTAGIYKNGKPYKGYFPQNIKELLIVDYYEKGKKKIQYLKENVLSNKNDILSVKSTYKKDQIYDGVCHEIDKKHLVINHLKKGKLIKQVYWVFPVDDDNFEIDYDNAITIAYNDNGFIITEKNEPRAKLIRDKNKLFIFFDDKEVIRSIQTGNTLKNKEVLFYEKNGIFHRKVKDQSLMLYPEEYDTNISNKLFSMYDELSCYKNYTVNMNTFMEGLTYPKYEVPFVKISYDNNSNPKRGIIVTQKGKKYSGKVYKKGKLSRILNKVSKDSINNTYRKEFF